MPLAGPESFSQQQLDYLKKAMGVDETVLWSNSSGLQLDSGVSIVLSEATTNFDRIMLYHGITSMSWGVINTFPGKATRYELVRDSYDRSSSIIRDGQDLSSSNNVTFTTSRGIRRIQFNTDGTFTLSTSQSTEFKLFKVVGIHRIAGGN